MLQKRSQPTRSKKPEAKQSKLGDIVLVEKRSQPSESQAVPQQERRSSRVRSPPKRVTIQVEETKKASVTKSRASKDQTPEKSSENGQPRRQSQRR